MEYSLGEKIETIIFSRKDGLFGEYMGSSAETFGAARIDGIVYKVARILGEEITWVVHNVNTGIKTILEGQHAICYYKG